MHKELLSLIAIALTFFAFIPYIRSIHQGKTKPHVFSWFIWGTTTFVIFLAQLAGKGGAGAWPIGISGIITLYITWLAYQKKSDLNITRTDWIFLIGAIFALPLWYLTADPVWTVIILTTIDILGFGPTYRKAYHQPFSENLYFYFVILARNIIVTFALEHYSVTTAFFPVAVSLATFLLITMIILRRKTHTPTSGTAD